MSTLIFSHILFGLIGIISGLVAVTGMYYQRRMPLWNAVFLATTAAACLTGFVFLPSVGVTSAQLVSFFLTFLLMTAVYARYIRRLAGSWIQVYAFLSVGALFLNILIAMAQSFLHLQVLRALAPTQNSPLFIAVKLTLLFVFVVIAIVVAGRADAR